MKTIKTIVALAILFGCSATANAQLGGLVKKVKKAAAEKVESSVKDAKKEAKSGVEQKAKETAGLEKPAYDPNRKYKPSKEALAADPQASDETIEEGFTKSIGEIHACFEQISDIAPYGPYYTENAKKFWGMDKVFTQPHLIKMYFGDFADVWKQDPRERLIVMASYDPVNSDEPQVKVPRDEYFINFWTCRFIADPKSEQALKEYLYTYIWLYHPVCKLQYRYKMKDELKGIIDDNNIMYPELGNMRWNRNGMAYDLATSITPVENLLKLADESAKGITAADGDAFSHLFNHFMLDVIVNDFLSKHDKAPDSQKLQLLKLKLESPRIGKLIDAYQNDFVEAVSEPKGVNVDAKTRIEGIAAAQKFAGANFEKAVFTKGDWQTFKEQKWPYRITAYALPIAIITKEGGKRYVQYCTLTKSADGSKYFVQASMDTRKHPIK